MFEPRRCALPRSGQPTAREREIRVIYRILSHRLLRRIIRRQGVDLAEHCWRIFDDMIIRALHRCAACSHKDACRDWLAHDHPSENYPRFCPNGEVIEACRILDPRAAPAPRDAVEIAGRREPPLDEVLAEPIVRQLIDADHACDSLLGRGSAAAGRADMRLRSRPPVATLPRGHPSVHG
jgi:hypothetical protein